jgi:tripartite-type tricarboxylate transporter receptor subunit TctC
MFKKGFLLLACLLLILGSLAACGGNQTDAEQPAELDYPKSAIKMIIPYGAGGGTDTLARTVGSYIDLKGQVFVATNMPGANGLVASLETYNAPNDGYTLMCGIPETWVAQFMTESTDIKLYEEMTPLASFVYDANVVSVPMNSPIKTFEDLIKYAHDNPNKFSIASTGAGGSNEMTTYAIADAADFDFIYVPFDSASKARVAVLGGHNDAWMCQASEVKALYDAKELRPLAVATEERISFMSDVPTLKELGYDVVSGLHRSFWAPPGLSEDVQKYLEAQMKEVFDNPEVQTLLRDQLGFEPIWTGSEDLGRISEELAPILSQWVDLVKKSQ